jgi:hypothetical protein
MAKAGLSFGSPTLGAMDLEPLGNPYDPAPDIGIGNLIGTKEALGVQADAELGAAMSQFDLPKVTKPSAAQMGPNVLYSETQGKMFVNGSLFDLDDADNALRSIEYLDKPRQGNPEGDGWRPLTPDEYGRYIKAIKDPSYGRRFAENWETGVASLKSLFGAGAVLVGAEEYGLGVMERAGETMRKNAPFSGEFTEIGLGDEDLGPVEWFVGVLGSQGPMLLETIAAGAIGFVAGSATAGPGLGSVGGTIAGLTGKTAFKKAVKEAAEAYVKEKAKGKAAAKAFMKTEQGKTLKRASGIAGATAFAYTNNFGIGASDVYSELLEQGIDPSDFDAKMSALATAVPYALLDTIPEFVAGAKIFGGITRGSKGGRLRRGTTGAVAGGVIEGTTEAGQEGLIMGTSNLVTGKDYSDEALHRLINSFAAGFAIGAPIGGITNLKGNKEADLLQGSTTEQESGPTTMAPDQETGQGELFTEEETLSTDPFVGPRPIAPEDTTPAAVAERDALLNEKNKLQRFISEANIQLSDMASGRATLDEGRVTQLRSQIQQAQQAVATIDESLGQFQGLPGQAQQFAEQMGTQPTLFEPAPALNVETATETPSGQMLLQPERRVTRTNFVGPQPQLAPDPTPVVEPTPEPAPTQAELEAAGQQTLPLQTDLPSQIQQTAAQQPAEAQPNLLQQRMQEAARQAQLRAEEDRLRAEALRVENERIERNNRELENSLAIQQAQNEIAAYEAEQSGMTPVATPPAPVADLPTAPVPVVPPRQLDLFRGQVKLPKISKAEQKAINKANRLRRKQEQEAVAAAEEAARPMTPAEARAAGQGILLTQRGEPSVAALKAAGTREETVTPELVQATPAEETVVAQQQQINALQRRVEELAAAQEEQNAVQERSTAQVDVREQPADGEAVRGRNTEERKAAAIAKSQERIREEADRTAASRAEKAEETIREDSGQQGVQEDSVQERYFVDQSESEEFIVEELIYDFDSKENMDELKTVALSLMDYAYWSAAPSGTSNVARDYKAAREKAKAYVDKAFLDPEYFYEGQIKLLDREFYKQAVNADTRSSTQPWYEYATRRGLVESIALKSDGTTRVEITGKPHEKIFGKAKPKVAKANVSEIVDDDFDDTYDQAARDMDEKDGKFYRVEDGSEITSPLSIVRVQAIASKILGKLKTKPKIYVVRNQRDLLEKHPEVYARARASRPNNDFDTVNAAGFSVADEIILFSDNLKTEQQAKFVIAHEAMGHFGFRAFMPPAQLNKLLTDVYNSDSFVRRVADAKMELYGTDRLEAIEEVLADAAADIDASIVKRVWYAIKDALNAMGFNFEDDLARYMLRQSRRNLLQGGSSLVSMQELARNLKSLQTDNTLGRYSLAEDTADAVSRAMSSHAYTKRSGKYGGMRAVKQVVADFKDIENIKDVGSWFGSLLENVQSLDNLATRSDGLMQVFNIFQARSNRSRRFLSNYESMTAFSHSAFSFTDENGVKQTGPTSEELEFAGELLAHAALHKQATISDADIRDLGDLVVMDGNKVGVVRDNFQTAVEAGELTREDFQNGITVELGDQEQGVFEQRTYRPLDSEGNPRTITDRVWRIYTEQRNAVNQAALDVLTSHIEGGIAQREATIEGFKENYNMTDENTAAMRRVMEKYIEIYQANARQEGGSYQYDNESVAKARGFLREINRALFEKKKVDDWKQGNATWKDTEGKEQRFDTAEYQDIIDGLDALSARNYNKDKANQITSAVGNLYLLEVQSANAQFNAKRTIMTSYVPFTRRGNHQIRLAAYDENGQPVDLSPVWRTVLPYYQAGNAKDAREIAANLNEEFGGKDFEIEDANGKTRTITFRAISEKTRQGSVLGQQFSLNDFINTLARLDVNINPQERERIVEALTKQTDRARRSLQRAGVKGWDKDVVRSTSEYLETQGHIAGQTFYRHRLNNIMLRDSLWRGDYSKVQRLFAETQRTDLSPEQLRAAQTAYDKYAVMYSNMAGIGAPEAINRVDADKKRAAGDSTAPKTIANKGKGETYRATALGLQQWYADAANINDSTEDLLSGETGSRLKMWTVVAQLGGSVATAGINMVSMMTHSIPFLATYNEARGFGGGFGLAKASFEMQRAARNMGSPKLADAAYLQKVINDPRLQKKHKITQEEALFLADATSEGVLQSAQANALIGTARGGINSNKLQGGIKGWMYMFSYTEQLNRRSTALAAYRMHIQRAIAGTPNFNSLPQEQQQEMMEQFRAEATEFARNAVNTSQGEYGMFNRPEMARGNVGQYLFIYKQFSIITIQMLRNLSPEGRLYFIGMLMLMSGLKGMPFADDLMDLIDTLLQIFNIKEASVEKVMYELFEDLAPGSAKYIMRGGLDQWTSGTFSTRLGFGDMIPLTGAGRAGADTGREITNFFGPVYSGIEGAFATVGNATKYLAGAVGIKDQTMSFSDVFRDAPVAALRGLTDAYTYYDTGVVTNSQGKVIDPSATWGQTLMRAAGFYPSVATRSNDVVRLSKYTSEYVKALRADYTSAYSKAYIENDLDRMIEIELMVDDWNTIHSGTEFEFTDFKNRAKRSAESAALPTAQRYLKTAPKNVRPDTQRLMEIMGIDDVQ